MCGCWCGCVTPVCVARQVREIVRNPPGQPVAAGAALKSVKITARVGALGGDVLVVPRQQQRSGAEVSLSQSSAS